MNESPGISPSSTSPTGRPFFLSDAVILVVALAVGTAFARVPFDLAYTSLLQNRGTDRPVEIDRLLGVMLTVVYPIVAAMMAATIVLRMKPTRCGLRERLGEPGSAVCITALVALTIGFLTSLPLQLGFTGFLTMDGAVAGAWESSGESAGFAALGAWLALKICGRWAPATDWVDVMARALGMFWVLTIVLNLITMWRLYRSGP
ncbi:hypothetical protein [Paludisphaera rhizosphaerae]|uniref:hypothetical protein n=1 Tax=Paludisphaera rhizosphaerae TaxID=2711216 RepID=UPI0013EDC75E|nr:hypothetical protein [Paludisphaera rhizosphaerae]